MVARDRKPYRNTRVEAPLFLVLDLASFDADEPLGKSGGPTEISPLGWPDVNTVTSRDVADIFLYMIGQDFDDTQWLTASV